MLRVEGQGWPLGLMGLDLGQWPRGDPVWNAAGGCSQGWGSVGWETQGGLSWWGGAQWHRLGSGGGMGVGGGLVRQGSVEWDSREELERLGGEVWFWELPGS